MIYMESTAESSNRTSQLGGGLCLPFDEAEKILPDFLLQPQVRQDIASFLSQVDHLHNPRSRFEHSRTVFYYTLGVIRAATGHDKFQFTTSTQWIPLSDSDILRCEWEVTIQSITTELTSQVFDGADSHTITLSLLNILRHFSWETKVALTTLAFILTFGDNGLNLCPLSNLSFNDLPSFVKHLLDTTNTIAGFWLISKDPKFMAARTRYIVTMYWIIRVTVATSASHITTISSRHDKVGMATPSSWSEKLKLINGHLLNLNKEVKDICESAYIINDEEYERFKKMVEKDDHSDNKEVLNELLSTKDYGTLNLYYGPHNKKVIHLDDVVFQNKYVLLVLSEGMRFSKEEMHVIDALMKYSSSSSKKEKKDYPFEMVWIPIITNYYDEYDENEFETLRNSSWYSLDNPWLIKNEVRTLFLDDWGLCYGEPMIVVVDPGGNIVNQNAMDMVMIWTVLAFPFTTQKEDELWEQQHWSLDFVVDNIIDHQFTEWINKDKYIFMYGGDDIDWIRNITKMVQKVAGKCQVEVEMFYVGKSHNQEVVQMINSCVEAEKLSSCFSDPGVDLWYFWRRLKIILNSMAKFYKVESVLSNEIQRLHNWDQCSVEWGILAKGSRILVNGHGKVVLSTLNEFDLWKEEAYNNDIIGFGMGFQSHYNKLYQKKMPFMCHKYPIAYNDLRNSFLGPRYMYCPDCHRNMQRYICYLCHHSPSTS